MEKQIMNKFLGKFMLLIVLSVVCLTGGATKVCATAVSTDTILKEETEESVMKEEDKEIEKTETPEKKPVKAAVAIRKLVLSKTVFFYTGKEICPVPVVRDANGKKVNKKYYDVIYKKNKKIGTGVVRVSIKAKYKNKYKGSLRQEFQIIPEKSYFLEVVPKHNGFTVKWKKSGGAVTGYQMAYSTGKKPEGTKSVIKTYKGTVRKSEVKNLKNGKTYQIWVRAYKKVRGKLYYSEWSEVASVTTKKYLVAIDAGHQTRANNEKEPNAPGSSIMKAKVTGGAQGCVTRQTEYELNLAVAKKLKKELEARGYEVIMIRESNDVNISNVKRAEIANDAGADAFIRIHANSYDNSSLTGAMTICQTSGNPYCKSTYKESKALSVSVLDHIVSRTGCRRERVWETDTMTGINWCKVPVTIVEMGYLSNPTEDRKLATDDYRNKMALGIADGIDEFFK